MKNSLESGPQNGMPKYWSRVGSKSAHVMEGDSSTSLGMTEEALGMTEEALGMTEEALGMTEEAL